MNAKQTLISFHSTVLDLEQSHSWLSPLLERLREECEIITMYSFVAETEKQIELIELVREEFHRRNFPSAIGSFQLDFENCSGSLPVQIISQKDLGAS